MNTSIARVGAWTGFVSVVAIFGYHMGLMAIAGDRVSGAVDAAAIQRYYAHALIAPAGIVPTLGLIPMLIFALALRESLARDARFVATLGLVFLVCAVPLYVAAVSLEAAMVTIVQQGGDPLGFYRLWDVLYNSFAYVFEAGYIFCFGIATRGQPAFPRWLPGWAVVTAALQLVNSSAIWVGIPDQLTLFPNLAFVGWFVGCSIGLARLARRTSEARDAHKPAPQPA